METPLILLAELKLPTGETLSVLNLSPKQFKTGSRGFFGNGKVQIGEKRYQAQVQLVEIGSKNQPEDAAVTSNEP